MFFGKIRGSGHIRKCEALTESLRRPSLGGKAAIWRLRMDRLAFCKNFGVPALEAAHPLVRQGTSDGVGCVMRATSAVPSLPAVAS